MPEPCGSTRESVANGIENVDKISRRSDLTAQRDARQDFHLIAGYPVNAVKLVIALEVVPHPPSF